MAEQYTKYRSYASNRRSCVACLSPLPNTPEVWTSDAYFNAIVCPTCGMIQVEPCLSEEGLSAFYQGYYSNRKSRTKLSQQRHLQYTIDSQYISRFISSGSVLDVGCSDGSFLRSLPNSFMKYGIDIELDPVTSSVDNTLMLHSGFFPDSKHFSDNSFDLITFRGVIEHLRNPSIFIDKSFQLLKPGGIIYFCATPNVVSPTAQIFKNRWNQWHPIEHPNLFSVKTLQTLLLPSRFILVDSAYPYLDTPYASPENDLSVLLSEVHNPSNIKSPPFWGTMLSAIFQSIA